MAQEMGGCHLDLCRGGAGECWPRSSRDHLRGSSRKDGSWGQQGLGARGQLGDPGPPQSSRRRLGGEKNGPAACGRSEQQAGAPAALRPQGRKVSSSGSQKSWAGGGHPH